MYSLYRMTENHLEQGTANNLHSPFLLKRGKQVFSEE